MSELLLSATRYKIRKGNKKKTFSRSANYRRERENACDKKADMQRVHTGLWG